MKDAALVVEWCYNCAHKIKIFELHQIRIEDCRSRGRFKRTTYTLAGASAPTDRYSNLCRVLPCYHSLQLHSLSGDGALEIKILVSCIPGSPWPHRASKRYESMGCQRSTSDRSHHLLPDPTFQNRDPQEFACMKDLSQLARYSFFWHYMRTSGLQD